MAGKKIDKRPLRALLLAVAIAATAVGVALAQDREEGPPVAASEPAAKGDPRIAQWKHLLAQDPPRGGGLGALSRAYQERALAARGLGLVERHVTEIEAGLAAVGATNPPAYPLFNMLAVAHADRGDFVAGLQAQEQAMALATSPVQAFWPQSSSAIFHASLNDRARALERLAQSAQSLRQLRALPIWSEWGAFWDAQYSRAQARVQYAFGSLVEAESASRACIASGRESAAQSSRARDMTVGVLQDCYYWLTFALLQLGRLEDAAIVGADLRDLAREVAERQGRPLVAARYAPAIAQIAIERGRLEDAIQVIDGAIGTLRGGGVADSSPALAALRWQRACVELLRGRWESADALFAERYEAWMTNAEQARRGGATPPEWAYALLRLGRVEQSTRMLQGIVAARRQRFGDESLWTFEARGFLAVAWATAGRRDAALAEFAVVVPRLLELSGGAPSSSDAGELRALRLQWILDAYLALLAERAGAGAADAIDESWRSAARVRGRGVNRSQELAASRAVIGDAALAQLARRYHDQQRRMGTLADGLDNLLARGRVAGQDEVAQRIRADLDALRREQLSLKNEIETRFPAYASLIEPRPPSIGEVQRLLRPGEALVTVFAGETRSYVWCIGTTGAAVFVAVPLSATQIARQVAQLRRSVDNLYAVQDVSQIRAFDFDTAHTLYQALLAPIEPALRGADSLIVVTHAELGQLPLGLLTTAPFRSNAAAPSFDGYADAPWLIKRFALSQLPSTTALASLRGVPRASRAELAFVGIADPRFARQPAAAQERAVARSLRFARQGPVPLAAGAEERGGPAAHLHRLEPLPESADEVREIAGLLGADPARDLYLHERASERNVKTADLSRYRTVMFATHGLLPGMLPGLSQPALALTHPSIAGDGEDGLLMLDEILSLKLQADWVVLSACSTASPDVLSTEAVSGLGRAFFFAGARGLLVTAWPIESESARRLTTALFRFRAARPERSGAHLLRDASLAMMSERAPGTPSLGYGHPVFWAPFVLFGDGY